MNLHIDRDGCIGCGLCEATCPAVFRIASDGLAEVHAPPTSAAVWAEARQAAADCPVSVIRIEE